MVLTIFWFWCAKQVLLQLLLKRGNLLHDVVCCARKRELLALSLAERAPPLTQHLREHTPQPKCVALEIIPL